MKVAFDISVLGTGQYYPHSRTGIHRVVESLASGLAGCVDLDLAFSCTADGSFIPAYGAGEYLAAHAGMQHVPLVSTRPSQRLLARAIGGARRTRAATEHFRGHSLLDLPAKAVRYVSARSEFRMVHRPNRFDTRQLDAVDVFHSPYDPLPKAAHGRRRARRVITIYDLIAVRQPELFEAHIPPLVRKTISSITPDDWVTCISECTKQDLCEFGGVNPERVRVTYLAASRNLFYPSTDENLGAEVRRRYRIPDSPYILSLNTIEPRKNLDHAIRCFARMVNEQRIDDLNFVLVGGRGWDFDHIFAEAARNPKLRDRIIFAGRVADEDLASLYSGAVAFVYPSLYEGFGLPPLEAMQCGVPVVTSDTSSLPEVVGDAGLLVNPRDEDALSGAMWRLYSDRYFRADLAAKALAHAELFSWDRCVEETVATYHDALRE
jgi:glycosyltransferase involved in cell wall biosynthesis